MLKELLLSLSFGLMLTILAFGCLVIKLIIIAKLPLRNSTYFDVYFTIVAGALFNSILPAKSGELVRVFIFSHLFKLKLGSSLIIVGFDRVIDVISIIIFGALGFVLIFQNVTNIPLFSEFTILIIGIVVFFIWLQRAGYLDHFNRWLKLKFPDSNLVSGWSIIYLSLSIDRLVVLLTLALLGLAANIFAVYWTLEGLVTWRAVPLEVDLTLATIVTLGAVLGMIFSFIPAGFGTYEAAVSYVLSTRGIEWDVAVQLSVSLHLVQIAYVISVFLLIFSFRLKDYKATVIEALRFRKKGV